MAQSTRVSLSLAFLLFAAAAATAQTEARGVWLPTFRGAYLQRGAQPVRLSGGLVPRIGFRATLVVDAPGSDTGMLMLGTDASTGLEVPFGAGSLPLYVTPLVTAPLALSNGAAQLSVNIPNDPRLVGTDLALQATGLGRYGLAVSNLLLANIGEKDNGPWGKVAIEFSGRAPKHERNHNRVFAGDLKDLFGASMPFFTNYGQGRYLIVQVQTDRALTSNIEIRTGTQRTGTLVGTVTKRGQSLTLRVPDGSRGVPLHLYFHNTDPNADVGIRWQLIGG